MSLFILLGHIEELEFRTQLQALLSCRAGKQQQQQQAVLQLQN
jgi:hypothetical protein